MYGLLLQNMAEYIRNKFGDNMWAKVKEQLNLELDDFGATETFPEGQIAKMGKTAMKVLSIKDEEFYEGMGKYFVTLAKNLGYEKTILQLGRRIRDFFLNLDNLHDYLKYTFPRMKAPSFFIEDEDPTKLLMQYRTRRRGFHYYVQGQVKEIAKTLFLYTGQLDNKLDCKLKKQEIVFDTAVFHYELTYDNRGFVEYTKSLENRSESSMPIRAGVLFEMFPFCILYEKDMTVKNMGSALRNCIPQMVGRKLTEYFELIKPLVDFRYEVIETRMNSMFELATQDEIDNLRTAHEGNSSGKDSESEELQIDDLEDVDKTLHIKGQMIYIKEWQLMLFLACPIMKGLNNLIWSGLFINELSMHDYSRDIMLANAQTDMEANLKKMQLAQKENLTKQNIDRHGALKKQNDELGYMFLPTSIGVEVIKGTDPDSLAQKCERMSFLMAEIEDMETICSKTKNPVDVVNLMNNMESIFDHLVKKNGCYKISSNMEYMAEAGASSKVDNPVEKIVDLALDMKDAADQAIRDPTNPKKSVKLKVSIGTGPVVTGVSGRLVPKFGVYGSPVSQSTLLMEECKGNEILVGSSTKDLLPQAFKVKSNKDVEKVGATFFIQNKEGREALSSKDIKALAPVEKAESGGSEGKAEASSGESGTESKPGAPAVDEGGPSGGDTDALGVPDADRPVSVAAPTQCCGKLGGKSGVCSVL